MKRAANRRPRTYSLPHIGQRMLKTALAVFACLAFYCLRGYRGGDMPTEAAITAIICMQPYVKDSRDYALNRMTGTLIGAGWGLLFLLLLFWVESFGAGLYLIYGLMAVGVLLSLYTAVALHKPDASGLSAIVFICIVIAFPDIEDPLRQTLDRFLGVAVGTAVAIGVNVFRLPRGKNPKLLFFLRTSDLIPDRFSPLSPAVLFRLNTLQKEGAKLCLISRHAPAFFISQLSAARLRLPMIVMDGAAIYDIVENRYFWSAPIPEDGAARLRLRLDKAELSYFLYTVHRNKTCVFHRGALTEEERAVLDQLRRSPYRSYLDEDVYSEAEIVCVKLIRPEAEIRSLQRKLQSFLRAKHLRSLIQPQDGFPGVSGLYIYSDAATVPHAQARMLEYLSETEPDLQPVSLSLPQGYRSEHDAMVLLYRLRNLYAPIWPLHRRQISRKGRDG